jgi:DnaJ-class molecular chaperone
MEKTSTLKTASRGDDMARRQRKRGSKEKVRRQRKIKQEPERCPVCEGSGVVPQGFYDPKSKNSKTATEPCRGCEGTGIVTVPEVLEHEKEKQL